jgi:hypothetical protein
MSRKTKGRRSVVEPIAITDMSRWPSPLAAERKLDPREFGNWAPECRGDVVETVADLFRYLRRAREYLVEADRQLRLEDLSAAETASREAWYAEMDAADEWTGLDAHAHIACAQKIIQFFDGNPGLVASYDGKPFIVEGARGKEWQHLRICESVKQLRQDVGELLMRVASSESSH